MTSISLYGFCVGSPSSEVVPEQVKSQEAGDGESNRGEKAAFLLGNDHFWAEKWSFFGV
jgi:hypothetical protein